MSHANGYVADQEYTSEYHHLYTPAYLDYIALLNGIAPPERPAGAFRFCDLGCGFGMTALTLAASNPSAAIHGIDFMAEHIDVSRKLATDAGLANAQFHCTSFADALDQDFEPFDYIVAHGVYSWVSASVRQEVVAFIQRYLKPGGIAYISYNAMPGCADLLSMQKLVSYYGARGDGPSSERVLQAFGQINALRQLGAKALVGKAGLDERLASIANEDPRYLAHEYLHQAWEPRYFIDVAAELECAEVEFVGSATLVANDPRFLLTQQQQALINACSQVNEREMLKDYLLDSSFRRDLWGRQPARLETGELERRLGRLPFMLTVAADAIDYTVQVGYAQVSIDTPIARNLIKALAGGPKTISQLLSRWDMMSASAAEVRDILFMLTCSQQATPVEQDKVATATRLNDVLRSSGYPCRAIATPYGVGLDMSLPDVILALRPQDSGMAPVEYLRDEYRRIGRFAKQTEADLAMAAQAYQTRRLQVIHAIKPVAHI